MAKLVTPKYRPAERIYPAMPMQFAQPACWCSHGVHPARAARPHRKPCNIPRRSDFLRRRQSVRPAATLPANKTKIREAAMARPKFGLALAAGLLAFVAALGPSRAQDYPTHAVRIVVPFG